MPDETRDAPVPPADGPTGEPAGTRTHDPGPTAGGPDDVPTRATGPSGPATYDPSEPTGVIPAVPGYEILGELGRGGMGVVYHARDTRLNRELALKMILRADPGRAAVARFWAEAEVMAAVRHPHVVQVFELGEAAGRPFMAMELVPGGSLADRLKATPDRKAGGPAMPLREAAGLLEKTARGVAAAHDLGVVHRDLKPGNVLLAADGTPKVTDFGLAKRGAVDLTQTQTLMGTPAYMAPEQAAGRAKFVGPQADVWALGVILYECVSGGRPFHGESVQALLSQIQSAEPAALRTLVRAVPRDLDTVVSKCLAKEPEHRYPTAADLADDLARFARGEPIAARPVGHVERLVRWVRRKPATAAAYGFSALAAVLAAVVLVVSGFWREAEGAKVDAEAARDQLAGEQKLTVAARDEAVRLHGLADAARQGEERARREVAFLNYAHAVDLAHRDYQANNLARARELLDGCPPDLRQWEWAYVHNLCHSDLATLTGHTDAVRSASFSADGRRVVTASRDGTARVWDAASGEQLALLNKHTGWVTLASFSPDGRRVVTACADKTARVWDAASGEQLAQLNAHMGIVFSASFSADGRRVTTASDDGTARVWDAASGEQLALLNKHTGWVFSASFSPDGRRVATASADKTARVWDATSGKQLALLTGHTVGVKSASFSVDGRRVVTACADKTARVWDAASGEQLALLTGHTGDVTSASFSPDGRRVVTASEDTTIRVWDTGSGKLMLTLPVHGGPLRTTIFCQDGTKILTMGRRPAEKTFGVLVYDSRPVNRAFIPLPLAPPPRAAGR